MRIDISEKMSILRNKRKVHVFLRQRKTRIAMDKEAVNKDNRLFCSNVNLEMTRRFVKC